MLHTIVKCAIVITMHDGYQEMATYTGLLIEKRGDAWIVDFEDSLSKFHATPYVRFVNGNECLFVSHLLP